MLFKNSRLWVPHRARVIARDCMLILSAAFLLRYAAHDLLQPYAPFHFFIVACLAIAVRYGHTAALICLAISMVIGNYFFVQPYYNFSGHINTSDWIINLTFFLVTGTAIAVIEKLQRTIYSQKLLIKIMKDQQRSMLFRQNELIQKMKSYRGT